ncbi:MAG: hypothetical protein KBD64_06905, partial [Gammaproteobacteria bacterium]|nr:hypothetical protein [Gammaproteobacteria bacterium]
TNPNMFREKDIPKKVVELCKELTKDVLNGKKVNWSKKKSLEACRKELVRILRSSLLAKAEKERRFERFSALARQFPLSQVGSEIRIIIQKSVEEGEKIEVVREMASAVESVEPSAEACGLVIMSKTDSVSSSPSSDTEESVGPDSPGESPYVTSIVAVSYNPDTRTPTRPDDAQSRTIYHHR